MAKTARYFVPEYLRPSISIPIIMLAISDPALKIMCNGIGISKLRAQLFTTLTPKYMITICNVIIESQNWKQRRGKRNIVIIPKFV